MIYKYRFGNPVATDTVVLDLPPETGQLPFETEKENRLTIRIVLGDDDLVFGLGENMGGINKRGFTYISRCMDGARHTEDRSSLYAAHNFLIVKGKEESFGLYLDASGIVSFDVGETEHNTLEIVSDDDCDVYLVKGASLNDIVRQFHKLIGRSYIPPKWAFGYGQSRWYYKTEADFRQIVETYQKEGIPLDAIYMDIDYMDGYASFTINEDYHPDFEGFVKEMQEQGVHVVPIIDAAIKIKPGYSVYEEGVAGNYFCKTESGANFIAGVWPGDCHLPDVLNSKARRWFGDQYRFLLDKGIDGIWNDMNEPSIFYTHERLAEAYDYADRLRGKSMPLNDYFGMRHMFTSLSSNPEDYKLFYHDMDGVKVRHDKVHNLYGYNITRAAGEAFERLSPDRRILLFSRGSMIGMHRTSGIWTGDNMAWWSHLKLAIAQMANINMCGFLYTGTDLGGFGSDTNEELMSRWLAFGLFTPLFRNHSQSRREQELYTFACTERMRHFVELRYRLIPYLYSEFVKAALADDMFIKPLGFAYENDDRALRVEDQLLVGESIMIAPVYENNARGRYVYLPETMKMIRCRTPEDMEETILEKGDHYIPVSLDEVVFFIRLNHIVPLASPAQTVKDMDFNTLQILSYADHPLSYTLYDDDGYTRQVENPAHFHTITADSLACSCPSREVTYLGW